MFCSIKLHPIVGELHYFQHWERDVPHNNMLVIPIDPFGCPFAWRKRSTSEERHLFQQTSQWIFLTPLLVNICTY